MDHTCTIVDGKYNFQLIDTNVEYILKVALKQRFVLVRVQKYKQNNKFSNY